MLNHFSPEFEKFHKEAKSFEPVINQYQDLKCWQCGQNIKG